MNSAPSELVTDAIVLAAGNGDRFQDGTRRSKLLHSVLGQPLIIRTLATASAAGIASFDIVLGYQAEALREVIERGAPKGSRLHFTYNPKWHQENGVSVLAARDRFPDRRFALLMGDHLFEAPVLSRLLRMPVPADESILAIDARPAPADLVAEATKVRRRGDHIVAIGKDLRSFDALDTGLFVCAPPLFAALEISRKAGDTTLSGGIRQLATRGLMRGADVGAATWCDIDTIADLAAAETLLAARPEPEPA
ncbi:MAG: NTP transferase domain-containing protein [Acidobacteriota bacterium]